MTIRNATRSVALVLAVALGPAFVSAQSDPGSGATIQRLHSPEIQQDQRITFRLLAPEAKQVLLNGSWPGGAKLPMIKDAHGVWTATAGPLRPELYSYVFIVDGVRALDPNNAETQRDGSRFGSLLMISGPESAWWDFKDVAHGSVEQIWYPSPALHQTQRRMYVYLPPGYHHDAQRKYPVLYLLHGGGGDEDSWITLGRAAVILDNQIASRAAVPMIVVMPNGNDDQTVSQGYALGPTPSRQQVDAPPPDPGRFALHAPQIREPYAGAFPESLVKDLIPFVERTYRSHPDAAHRAIAGLSMGAAQTVVTTANNPELFAYIGVFSGGGRVGDADFQAQVETLARSKLELYWTGAGDDDIARLRTIALYEHVKAKGLPAMYREIPGGHTWPVWRDFLADFAPRLFK